MKLFFETSIHSQCFLMTVPLGFILTLFLDTELLKGSFLLVADILVVFCAGMALLLIVIQNGENSFRLYHLLGLLVGSLLYICGAGRLFRILRKHFFQKRKRMQDKRMKTAK